MKVEIIQALFELGLTKYRISKICGLSRQYVGQVINGQYGVILFESRDNKEDLLKQAEKIIKNERKKNMRNLKEIANSLETSLEIVQAIVTVFEIDNEEDLVKIWEDPSEEQSQKILNYAWNHTDDFELFWGIEKIFKSE